jgi:hypothetical protein
MEADMVCGGYTKVWDLASGEVVRMDGARGTTLRVTRGTLWLTQERELRDIVLSAGDVFTIERGGVTLVEALDGATVCVLARHVDEVRMRAGRKTLGRRVGDWLHSVAEAGMNRRWAPYV